MKTKSVLSTSFLVGFVWTISPHELLSQNSVVPWSAFSSGFGVATSSTSIVKSSVGQAFAGSSQQANNLVESGFLVNPLLRGPLVGVEDHPDLPLIFSLSQNYPNPFNPSTTIRYEIPRRSNVELLVYNLLGQRIATLVDVEQDAGRYAIVWNGNNEEQMALSSGVYFYRFRAGDFVETKKLLLLK